MILIQFKCFSFCSDILQVQLHMDSILLVPLLTPSTRYSEWKLKMIACLKRQGLYEVSIGIGKESYKDENDQLNYGDRDFGTICMTFWRSPSLHYLIDFAKYPKDLQIEPLGSTIRIIIEIWREHSEPQEFFIQKYHPILSLMKLFKMKQKQSPPPVILL